MRFVEIIIFFWYALLLSLIYHFFQTITLPKNFQLWLNGIQQPALFWGGCSISWLSTLCWMFYNTDNNNIFYNNNIFFKGKNRCYCLILLKQYVQTSLICFQNEHIARLVEQLTWTFAAEISCFSWLLAYKATYFT